MIYIVEGIDRNGKSTLINDFQIQKNFETKWFGVPEKDPVEWYSEYFNDSLKPYANNSEKNIMFDRSFFSEVIYGNIFRNANYNGLDVYKQFDDILAKYNAKIIYCETDLDTNWNLVLSENKKEIMSLETLKNLRNEANRILNLSKLPVIKYNFKTDNKKELFDLN